MRILYPKYDGKMRINAIGTDQDIVYSGHLSRFQSTACTSRVTRAVNAIQVIY